jgi:hypothetical protein
MREGAFVQKAPLPCLHHEAAFPWQRSTHRWEVRPQAGQQPKVRAGTLPGAAYHQGLALANVAIHSSQQSNGGRSRLPSSCLCLEQCSRAVNVSTILLD